MRAAPASAGAVLVLAPGGAYAVPAPRGQPVWRARKKAIATIAIPTGIVITSIQYQAAATVIAPAATRPIPSNGLRLLVSSPEPTAAPAATRTAADPPAPPPRP